MLDAGQLQCKCLHICRLEMLTLVMLMHMLFFYHTTEADNLQICNRRFLLSHHGTVLCSLGRLYSTACSSRVAVFGSSKLLPCHLIIIDVHHLLEFACLAANAGPPSSVSYSCETWLQKWLQSQYCWCCLRLPLKPQVLYLAWTEEMLRHQAASHCHSGYCWPWCRLQS